MTNNVVLVSGGFDPLHIAHVRYLEAAAKYGDIVVALNSDAWLERKKGYRLQCWADRAAIMENQKGVVGVVRFNDADGTCREAIRETKPRWFAKGGGSSIENTPEVPLCRELGIEVLFLGPYVAVHSRDIVEPLRTGHERQTRPWGFWEVLSVAPGRKVKRLVVDPGKALSLQKHQHRCEDWIVLGDADVRVGGETWRAREGAYVHVPAGQIHRLGCPGPLPVEVIEVQRGEICDEADIVRF